MKEGLSSVNSIHWTFLFPDFFTETVFLYFVTDCIQKEVDLPSAFSGPEA
jgi:hypothetical protein